MISNNRKDGGVVKTVEMCHFYNHIKEGFDVRIESFILFMGRKSILVKFQC